jgi:GntR family transcriptional regulator
VAEQPMYRVIAEDLRARIEAGELRPGSQIPTELELRECYGASRNTVRDAIKWLANRDLVKTRPGQGTFVVEKINPFITTLTDHPTTGQGGGEGGAYVAEVEATHRKPDSTDPRVEIQRADAVIADALRIKEGEAVVIRHQRRFIDGTPWSLQTSYYPMTLVMDKGASRLLQAQDIPEGTVEYLAATCQIKQAGYRDIIAVRPPDTNETEFFGLPADGRVSVFEIFRVSFDGEGERFRLTVTVYPVDRNRLRVDVGAVPPGAVTATEQVAP